MPATTPPKGRPTPGRRDRSVAQHRAASRRRIIRYVWAVVAIVLLGAVLVLGTGTGSDVVTNNPNQLLLLPALRWLRLAPPTQGLPTSRPRRYHQ